MKTVWFLGHSNNDVDHFLPVMMRFQEENALTPVLLCFPSEKILLQNKIHRFLLKETLLGAVSANAHMLSSFFLKTLFAILEFLEILYARVTDISLKSGSAPFRAVLIFCRKVVGALKLPVGNILASSIRGEDCVPALEKMFSDISPACIVLDTAHVFSEEIEDSAHLKMRGIVVRFAYRLKIPIYMLSHGVSVRYSPSPNQSKHPFVSPDVLALCNADELSKIQTFYGTHVKMKILGDTRYDIGWMRTLEYAAHKISEEQALSKDGKVALYLVANFNWVKDETLLNSIHADICDLRKRIEGLNVWVKLHPRYPLHFPLMNFTDNRLRIFGNDTDTNLLLAKADVVISPFSAVLFHPMLLKKRAVFYDRIRAVTKENWKCVFDKTACLDRATTPQELETICRDILDGKEADFPGLEEFYKTTLSGGAGLGESIAANHVREILRLCREKDRI